MLTNDISYHSHRNNGFIYPNWQSIYQQLPSYYSTEESQRVIKKFTIQWLREIKMALKPGYQIHQSANFILLTKLSKSEAEHAGKFAEEALTLITSQLEGLAQGHAQGKHVCLIFEDTSDYIRYTEAFYENEEIPLSGGICIHSSGYVHFAFPTSDYSSYKRVLAHELTHACLAHEDIPYWLNEAIAMRMEHATCDTSASSMDQFLYLRHTQHWNSFTIQKFWSGESWQIVGEANELSYSLAEILWRKIEVDLGATTQELVHFLSAAKYFDAGDSACHQIFGISLKDLLTSFLGHGDWQPNIELWNNGSEDDGCTIAELENVNFAPIENISSAQWHYYSTSRGSTPKDSLTRITEILLARQGKFSDEEIDDAVNEGLWQWLCDDDTLFSISPIFLDHVLDLLGETHRRHPQLLHFIKTCRDLGSASIYLSSLEIAQNMDGKLPIYRIEDVLKKYGLSA
ncbi:hypothetical protein [Rubritalea tangerina]|uniref:DUF1570 domain-containing protein n=1 Tax=Rubritalea tangerina TaxID=430798 RepID=A0ABW4ZF06_9BACT